MSENNGIAGADAAKTLICIDLEAVVGQGPYLVILILEIDDAVTVLEGPHERQAIRVRNLAFDDAFIQRTRPVGPEDDHIVRFTTRDLGIEGVEDPRLVAIETRLFVFPGSMGKQFKITARSMNPVTGAQGKRRRYE